VYVPNAMPRVMWQGLHYTPEAVIKSIIYFCNDGNNSFLDEKLEQLRMINNLMR
jgi:hypothetical protein